MVVSAIGDLNRRALGPARWWIGPLGWTGASTLLVAGVLTEILPSTLGIVLLGASVAAASWRASWRGVGAVPELDVSALAFAVTGDGRWDYDLTTGAILYDDRCADMLGYAPGSIASHLGAWGKLVHPGDLAHAREALDDFISGRASFYAVEVRLRGSDGRWRRILDRAHVAARDGRGRATRLVGVHRLLPDPEPHHDQVTLETASVTDIIERAIASRGKPHIGVRIRSGEDLGAAWVDGPTLTRGLARLFDAVAQQVPDGTLVPVRPRAPRDLGLVGFSLGLPPCASVDPSCRDVEAARSLLQTSGGRLRVRHDQLVVELPAARGGLFH